MTDPVTEQQIDRERLRKLADAATPGPWKQDEDDGVLLADIYTEAEGEAFQDAWDREDPDIRCDQGVDAEFIAAARTAVPQLLDQLDQAEARIKAVRDLHRPYGDTLTGLYICTACDQPCPCPTTRALEG